MKKLRNIIAILSLAIPLAAGIGACHSIENWDNNYYDNFDALWKILDEHYCFFEDKGVDWDAVGKKYRAQINNDLDEKSFFALCADMLDELKDGHTNLISWFDVSYYRQWWSDYPQNFNWRLIQEKYLNFDYTTSGGFSYKVLGEGKAAYCRYASFSSGASDSFINDMMLSMKDCYAMILDLRDNGGGELSRVETIVSHFIDQRTRAGYIQHKTGPGHNDFSEPYAYYYDPVQGVRWLKPVIILTNRSTFSAANNCVQVMKSLPNVIVVGDRTGGGSGVPFSSSLPCGYAVRFSASPIYDPDMVLTENGIEPDVELNTTEIDTFLGKDAILDAAIAVIIAAADDAEKDNQSRSVESIMQYLQKAASEQKLEQSRRAAQSQASI